MMTDATNHRNRRGGPRASAGRPSLAPGATLRNVNARLPADIIEAARKIGDGKSVSLGLIRAVEAWQASHDVVTPG
jgi:hypothetical protein